MHACLSKSCAEKLQDVSLFDSQWGLSNKEENNYNAYKQI